MARTSKTADDSQNPSYAFLTIEQHTLLLPQREVRTLESVLDIRTEQPPAYGVGWLPFAHQDWPVYGLDPALHPLSTIPAGQRICVLLTLEEGYFGLLCSNVTTTHSSAAEFRPLPQAMAKPLTPLCALVRFEDRIGLVSSAMALATYFGIYVETLTTS
jgi:hypothetical protein